MSLKQPFEETTYNREEEYASAQRAAVEAVMMGRETLETTERQGEQLRNAEQCAYETEYKLDRATRLLRGMTWSGWLANKFTRDVEPPSMEPNGNNSNGSRPEQPPTVDSSALLVYEDVPPMCTTAAQAVQNYNANLQVLETCETEEQTETLKLICGNMFLQAKKEIASLEVSLASSSQTSSPQQQQAYSTAITFISQLHQDLNKLRSRQLNSQTSPRSRDSAGSSAPSSSNGGGVDKNKQELFQTSQKSPSTTTTKAQLLSETDVILQKQDDHLDHMARHLQDLGSLASNLGQSLAGHSVTLEVLDDKNDDLLFKSKMVTRRADRLIQSKQWTKTRAEFHGLVAIRHLTFGHYLAVSTENQNVLKLTDRFNETCLFGVWKRNGIYGFQSQYSRRWMGQNLLGRVVCSATSFDRREEWDTDDIDQWSSTPLLCTSAGWGNGGYLLVDKKDRTTLTIGSGGLDDKKIADVWSIQEQDDNRQKTSKKNKR